MKSIDEETRYQRILSQLSEFFPDYFVAVRGKNGICWRSSNSEWALGVMRRYISRRDAEDKIEINEAFKQQKD